VPFLTFNALLAIQSGGTPNQDAFGFGSNFTLSSTAPAINPVTQPVHDPSRKLRHHHPDRLASRHVNQPFTPQDPIVTVAFSRSLFRGLHITNNAAYRRRAQLCFRHSQAFSLAMNRQFESRRTRQTGM
jgi:hypothetical protein